MTDCNTDNNCVYCKKTFQTPGSLKKHQKTVKSCLQKQNIELEKCLYCDKHLINCKSDDHQCKENKIHKLNLQIDKKDIIIEQKDIIIQQLNDTIKDMLHMSISLKNQ